MTGGGVALALSRDLPAEKSTASLGHATWPALFHLTADHPPTVAVKLELLPGLHQRRNRHPVNASVRVLEAKLGHPSLITDETRR